jgi:hypothetical protein
MKASAKAMQPRWNAAAATAAMIHIGIGTL